MASVTIILDQAYRVTNAIGVVIASFDQEDRAIAFAEAEVERRGDLTVAHVTVTQTERSRHVRRVMAKVERVA